MNCIFFSPGPKEARSHITSAYSPVKLNTRFVHKTHICFPMKSWTVNISDTISSALWAFSNIAIYLCYEVLHVPRLHSSSLPPFIIISLSDLQKAVSLALCLWPPVKCFSVKVHIRSFLANLTKPKLSVPPWHHKGVSRPQCCTTFKMRVNSSCTADNTTKLSVLHQQHFTITHVTFFCPMFFLTILKQTHAARGKQLQTLALYITEWLWKPV